MKNNIIEVINMLEVGETRRARTLLEQLLEKCNFHAYGWTDETGRIKQAYASSGRLKRYLRGAVLRVISPGTIRSHGIVGHYSTAHLIDSVNIYNKRSVNFSYSNFAKRALYGVVDGQDYYTLPEYAKLIEHHNADKLIELRELLLSGGEYNYEDDCDDVCRGKHL